MNAAPTRLLIVGGTGLTQVGESLFNAAMALGISAQLVDHRAASAGPALLRRLSWRLLQHRPPRLGRFSTSLVAQCQQFRPQLLISTGTSPITASALASLRAEGVRTANFSTDDPFSRSNGAGFFYQSLRQYDFIFTPRRANLAELQQYCNKVSYLPFAFDPKHCLGSELTAEDQQILGSDVLIVGGCDADRIPFALAIARSGLQLALYGVGWDTVTELRPFARGHAAPETLRKATLAAKVSVCLVRRANRDGHVMRSFEAGAIGGCILAEDTVEHREIYTSGASGQSAPAARFFNDTAELVAQAQALVNDPASCAQLRQSAIARIREGSHRYQDRLSSMLSTALNWRLNA